MKFERAQYKDDASHKMHSDAWDKLLKAIEYEEKQEMASARTMLVMACNMELKALGFESMITHLNKTILPWNPKTTMLSAEIAKAAA